MTKAKKNRYKKKTQKEKGSLNSKNKKKRSHSSKTTALDCTLFSKKLKINRPKKRNEGKVPKKRKTQKKQNQKKDKKGLN